MFASLRAGSIVYILDKGENPSLKVGQVVSVTPPKPKFPTSFVPNPMSVEQVMEINVKAGDESFVFNNINPTLSVVDTGINHYVISDDKTAICSEIEAFSTLSKKTIESLPYHQRVVASCEKMLYDLNPSLQKEVERDREITSLREELSSMKDVIGELTNLLRSGANSNRERNKQ